jgi:glycosyltransferase involved in cell wall biosynthesis
MAQGRLPLASYAQSDPIRTGRAQVPLRVVAIIPALNEAGAIGRTIAALPGDVVGATIVVDGGSRDGTVHEARAAGAEVLVETRPGYGRACALGAARAGELDAEVALFLDGDGADPAEQAGRLVGPVLANEADFVLATRTDGQRAPGSMGYHQVLAGRLIGRAIGIACGVRYSDMSAFRAIRLDRLAALPMREMTYGWNLEMQMRAARAGLRVLEVPLPYRRRVAGHSKVAGTLRGTLKAGWRIMVTFLRVWLGPER